MPLDGVDALLASVRRIGVAADTAGQRVVSRSQTTFEAAVKASFTQAHRKGTPTPSRPGAPPAVVTGTLRRSFVADIPSRAGLGWSGRVYPTSVQARILELGGNAGRGGTTHIQARPYMAPTMRSIQPALKAIHTEEFGKSIKGALI